MLPLNLAVLLTFGAAPELPVPAAPMPVPAPVIAPELLAPRPVYGPGRRVQPAHRIALLEAGEEMSVDDPRVWQASRLLEQLTGVYVEDAPRIVELTVQVCQRARAARQPASPIEMLEGALRWKPPASARGSVPRQFEEFAARYGTLRIKDGKDHRAALQDMLKVDGK